MIRHSLIPGVHVEANGLTKIQTISRCLKLLKNLTRRQAYRRTSREKNRGSQAKNRPGRIQMIPITPIAKTVDVVHTAVGTHLIHRSIAITHTIVPPALTVVTALAICA